MTHHYYSIRDLRIGMQIRTRRRSEMHEPEWYEDKASGGLFYLNYTSGRIVPTEHLGQEYTIDSIQNGSDTFWGYQTYTDNLGRLVQTHRTLLYATLVAEILDGQPAETPRCDCGKDAAGRRDPGPHSYWCSLMQDSRV